jgi:hemoglobin
MNFNRFALTLATVFFASSAFAQTSLYTDLGGDKGLTKIVAGAIKRWEQNPALAEAFKNADSERLEKMLVLQFCSITGGGCKYDGGDMKTVHERMGVDTRQFNALAEDLQISLAENGVANSTQNRLIALLAPMKRDVVTK